MNAPKFVNLIFLTILGASVMFPGNAHASSKEIPRYEVDMSSGEWMVWRLKFKPIRLSKFSKGELVYLYIKKLVQGDKLFLVFSESMKMDGLLVYVYSIKDDDIIGWFETSPA